MAKNRQRDNNKTIDEKARLMSYASLTLNGIVLGIIVPMMFDSTEIQSKNSTEIINVQKNFEAFGIEQKEMKKEIKEVKKETGEIKGEQKATNVKLDMLISMCMTPSDSLIEANVKEARSQSKREIKTKEENDLKGKKKMAGDNSDVID